MRQFQKVRAGGVQRLLQPGEVPCSQRAVACPAFQVAVTMITRTAFGMAAYFSMAVSATGLGVTGLAAHQVSMQVPPAGLAQGLQP